MRVAGVELEDGRRVWVDARDLPLESGNAVLLDGEHRGWVFVAPEQLFGPLPTAEGTIRVRLNPRPPSPGCGDLPGADMPYLGQHAHSGDCAGIVVAVDPVERAVTLRTDGGEEQVVPLESVTV